MQFVIKQQQFKNYIDMGAKNLINYSNIVTILRIVLAVPIGFLLIAEIDSYLFWALFLMLVAEFTDWLDGHLARVLGQITDVGKVLDPMADSIYRIFVFTAFVSNGWLSGLLFIPFIVRDIVVAHLRFFSQSAGVVMGSRISGKMKAVAQAVAQILVVWIYANWGSNVSSAWHMAIDLVLTIAMIVTLISMFDYMICFHNLFAPPNPSGKPQRIDRFWRRF